MLEVKFSFSSPSRCANTPLLWNMFRPSFSLSRCLVSTGQRTSDCGASVQYLWNGLYRFCQLAVVVDSAQAHE
ncbi:hypothetical protein RSAG8_07735, partial [Rhizoctonia solani AG-8 WAC10335]